MKDIEFSNVTAIKPDDKLKSTSSYDHYTGEILYNPSLTKGLSEAAIYFILLHEVAHSEGIENFDGGRIEAREFPADAFAVSIMVEQMGMSPRVVRDAVYSIPSIPIARKKAVENLAKAYQGGGLSSLNANRTEVAREAFYEGIGGITAYEALDQDTKDEAWAELTKFTNEGHMFRTQDWIRQQAKAIGEKYAQRAALALIKSTGDDTSTKDKVKEETDSNNTMLFLGLGVAAIMAIVVIVILIKR